METREKAERANLLNNKGIKKKFRFKRAYFCIKLVLFMALAFAVLIPLALSPLFNVRRITVEGNRHYSAESVVSRTGIATGVNGFKCISGSPLQLLSFRCGKAEQNLYSSSPYIKAASIRFIPPGTIAAVLEERTPAFTVPYLGTSLVIDGEGFVVDISGDHGKLALPEVKGLKFASYELGEKLENDDQAGMDRAIRLTEAVLKNDGSDELKLHGLLSGIDISDGDRIFMVIDERITVNLGDIDDIEYKLKVLKQVFFKKMKETDRGLLDFTAGENLVFKPDENTG